MTKDTPVEMSFIISPNSLYQLSIQIVSHLYSELHALQQKEERNNTSFVESIPFYFTFCDNAFGDTIIKQLLRYLL
ncbi:hypothetical protein J11TS1_02660 [Oceanobacillus sp. J11TS1]|nr:hypothetical protein J11TS1_02660 [Oceanobacillus sp. J11TS1]